jgi:tRNA pseudouridine55 synthase
MNAECDIEMLRNSDFTAHWHHSTLLTPISVSGLLAVWKPRGVSSQKCITYLKNVLVTDGRKLPQQRQVFRALRVGHGGTLDPQAEGVLVMGIGRTSCRRLASFIESDKAYEVEGALGIQTDTQEIDGRVLHQSSTCAWQHITSEQANAVLTERFLGQRQQAPPVFSALHVTDGYQDGKGSKRAYEIARSTLQSNVSSASATLAELQSRMPTRTVRLNEFHVLNWSPPHFRLHLRVGKGFYVRSLVHEFGQALGCGAVVSRLVRVEQHNISRVHCLDKAIDAWMPEDIIDAIERANPIFEAQQRPVEL